MTALAMVSIDSNVLNGSQHIPNTNSTSAPELLLSTSSSSTESDLSFEMSAASSPTATNGHSIVHSMPPLSPNNVCSQQPGPPPNSPSVHHQSIVKRRQQRRPKLDISAANHNHNLNQNKVKLTLDMMMIHPSPTTEESFSSKKFDLNSFYLKSVIKFKLFEF